MAKLPSEVEMMHATGYLFDKLYISRRLYSALNKKKLKGALNSRISQCLITSTV